MAKTATLSIALGVDVDGLKKGFQDAIKATQSAGKATEQEAKLMADGIIAQLEKIGSAKTMRQAIRQMENLAGTMQSVGLSGTKAFNEVVKQTANLKAGQQDLKDLIEASRPDAPFKAMANALQAGTQAFAGIQGAMALLGDNSEETQKIMVKLQAAMAIAEGTKSIDMLGDAFVQIGTVLKTSVLPALMTLKGALIATGIGALVVGLGIVIDHFSSMADEAERAAEAADKALNFVEKVSKLDKMDMEIAINRAKARGASEKEIFDIRKRYSDMAISDLIDAGQKGAEVSGKVFELRKQQEIELSSFELQEAQRRNEEKKKEQEKRLEIYRNGVAAQKQIIEEIQTINKTDLQVQEIELKRWYETKKQLLVSAGLSTLSLEQLYAQKVIKIIKSATDEISGMLPKQGIKTTNTIDTRILTNQKDITGITPRSIQMTDELAASLNDVYFEASQLNTILNQASADGLTNMATAIGVAIASGQDLGQAIGQSFLTSLADFLQQMGKMMITTAAIWESFQKTLAANPALAIGLGIAAVAAGAALKSHIAAGAQPKAFASGGMVNSPTFALIGDNLNASNNPEFVLRRDQLSKIYASGGGQQMQLSTRISGNDLLILMNKTQSNWNRI